MTDKRTRVPTCFQESRETLGCREMRGRVKVGCLVAKTKYARAFRGRFDLITRHQSQIVCNSSCDSPIVSLGLSFNLYYFDRHAATRSKRKERIWASQKG